MSIMTYYNMARSVNPIVFNWMSDICNFVHPRCPYSSHGHSHRGRKNYHKPKSSRKVYKEARRRNRL